MRQYQLVSYTHFVNICGSLVIEPELFLSIIFVETEMREFFALVRGHVVSTEVVELSSSVLQRLTIFSVGFKTGKSFF